MLDFSPVGARENSPPEAGVDTSDELPQQKDRPKNQRNVVPKGFVLKQSVKSGSSNWKPHSTQFRKSVQDKFGDESILSGPVSKTHFHIYGPNL